MAAPTGYIGHLGTYEKSKETFSSYMERADMFFKANNIVETSGEGETVTATNNAVHERMKAILLTEIGAEVYGTLVNLLAPKKAKDVPFQDVVDKLKEHFNPKPLEIAESYKFGTRNQKQSETISEYIVALKNLTLHCNFGTFLDRALRDRFVCGLVDERIQSKLLNTADLTFEKACKIATTMEMASKNAREFRPPATGAVHSHKAVPVTKPKGAKPKQRYGGEASATSCYRCNGSHSPQSCQFKLAKCYNCQKKGHIAPACRAKPKAGSKQPVGSKRPAQKGVHNLEMNPDGDELGLYTIYAADIDEPAANQSKDFRTKLMVNDQLIDMRIDTAADCSVMSQDTYETKFSSTPLSQSKVRLKTYSGETLETCGQMNCSVQHNGQSVTLPIIVAGYRNRPTLLGRDWLGKLKLDWNNIFSVESSKSRLDSLLTKHGEMFADSYTGITGHTAHIRLKQDAKPVYCRPRPVAYALKQQVEDELAKLERNGVLVKTDQSDWATPVVVVPKADKTVRLCGDYKVTINQAVDDEQYPLPTSQDLYAELSGAKVFTKLDLSHAYAQLNVDKESQPYLTINTHKGLYSYTKLPYGVKSSPKIFQSVMDKMLQGIPHCLCNQDDLLIATEEMEQHLDILEQVLARLDSHNVKLRQSKCAFAQPEVVYLGLKVNADGLHPVKEKVEAIVNAPKPNNVSELRSFLGMVQFYARFLPDLATVLKPLHHLLQKNVKWKWDKEQQQAYDICKKDLTSDTVLVHYDTTRELKLACDASSYGLGAVISHVMDDGQEKPIAFASRTLSPSERNYAQIEKEALGIVFGIKKFHQFLLGRPFTLVTDHKPLLAILGPKSAIPAMAASRMQRWAILLSQYDYKVEHRSSKNNAVADTLSRLPHENSDLGSENSVYTLQVVDEDFPVTATEIAAETQKDTLLKSVYEQTLNGWCEVVDGLSSEMKPFHNRRHELSCEQGCIKWGHRVVIPESLRSKILSEIHAEHPGIVSMKSIARSFVYWPGIDSDIETLVSKCSVCQSCRNKAPKTPLHPWSWPSRPFQRVHVDFCEKNQDHFLVLVDSHSKWIEVRYMGSSTTTERTIDELRSIFACHGLPEELVSDNGPQFRSELFKEFMQRNGVKHTLVPPYHPASNGAAERSVRIVKEALKKQVLQGCSKLSMKHRLASFLLKYRTTPQTTTGYSPAELLMKRRLRTRISLVQPNLASKVEEKQRRQKHYFDSHKKERSFRPDDAVRVLSPPNKSSDNKWDVGKIVGLWYKKIPS